MSTQVQDKVALPASISVKIGDAVVTAPAKPSAKGNIWFEAVQQGTVAEGTSLHDALLNAVVSFEGETITPAQRNLVDGEKRIATSSPRKYGKGSPKEGQDMPNTGGNPVISFVRQFPTWGERGFMLRVTLTGIEAKHAIRVSISCMGTVAGQARVVGSVDGALSF